MSERFLAEATVVVRADTSQARKTILDLNKIKVKAVQVPVKPNMSGFVGALRKGVLDASKNVVARIRVEPNMVGFKGKLQTAVATVAQEVTANVRTNVVPPGRAATGRAAAGAGAGQVATGGVTDKRAAEAQRAVNAAVDAGIAARRRINVELTDTEKRAARLTRELVAQKTAQDAVNKAIISGNPALLAQAENLERVATASVAKTQGQQLRATERVAAPAATAAAAEKAAADALAAEAASIKKRERLNRELTETAFQESQRRVAAIEAEVARAVALDKAAARARVESRATAIEQDPAFVTGQKIRNKLETESAAIERSLVTARRRLAVVDLEGAGATNAVSAARQRANAAEAVTARLATLVARAREIGVSTLIKETEALHAKAAAELRNQRVTLGSAEAEAAASKAQAFRARGFIAQLATFAGLRGAVLAANAQFIAGTVAAIAFGKAISGAAKFETELNVFRVTAGATASEMKRVSEEAKTLGRDITLPGVSAQDAAEAMSQLSRAGLDLQDSLRGARGVLQLATAAQISNADATQLAASALNAFGLSGDQAVHVADVLTNAANAAQGSISDMGIALQQSSAIARQVGISLEDTVTFLTLLAKNGIQGSDAGTSLRVAFTRLINPTDKAQNVLKKLNVQLRDAQGNIRPEVFSDFADAQANLTRKQQDANAAIVFGTDAMRAYAILSREGAAAFDEVRAALDKQGAAAELAGARTSGLSGSAENLKNQLSALGLELGQTLSPAIQFATDRFAGMVQAVNDTLAVFDKLGAKITDLSLNLGNIPQIKIGPFDTGELDRGIASLYNAIAGGPAFDAADASLAQLTQQLTKVQGEIRDFQKSSSGDFVPPKMLSDADALRDRIIQIGQAAAATGTNQGLRVFIRAFTSASPQIKRAISDGIITPLEKAQLGQSRLGQAFIKTLPKRFFIGLAADVKGSIEDATAAAKTGVEDLGPEIRSGIEDASREVSRAGTNFGNDLGDALSASLANAVTRAKGQLAGLQRLALDIEIAGGTPAQQLANLRKQEAVARRGVATREKQFARGEIAVETVTRAKQALADIVGKRRSLEESIQRDAKQAEDDRKNRAEKAARDLEKKRSDADQAVIDSFTGRQNRIDIASIRAGQTETLKDDLAIQVAIAAQASREIAIIDKTVKDAKTRRDAIAERVKTLVQATSEIDALRKKIADTAKQSARNARDLITETLGKRIQLAQLRGGREAILSAFAKAIADAKNRVKNAKKLGLVLIDEQIAYQQLIKDRNDFLKQTGEDLKQGTTAFDLMKQGLETFNASAGNLVFFGQPFASAAGFNADIAQFLKFRKQTPQLTPTAGGKTKLELNDDRLVRALDRVADAVERQGGNGSTATPPTPLTGSWRGLNEWGGWFNNSRTSRWAQES